MNIATRYTLLTDLYHKVLDWCEGNRLFTDLDENNKEDFLARIDALEDLATQPLPDHLKAMMREALESAKRFRDGTDLI